MKQVVLNDKGVAAVELAIVLPLLLAVLFGTIEMGLVLYDKQVVTNASREGARSAINKNVSDLTVKNLVTSYCNSRLISVSKGTTGIDPEKITIAKVGAGYFKVTVQYEYTYYFGALLGIDTPTLITGETTMREET